MKRILSFLLAAVIAMSVIPSLTVSASLRGSSIERKAELLSGLGIFPQNAAEAFDEEDTVTRQSFVEYTLKALGETADTVKSFSASFTDCEISGYAAKAYANGYISGYPDGSFKPSQPIKVSEAYKIIIDAAGYKKLAGEYPDSYVKLASETGLKENVYSLPEAEATFRDITHIIYNMLNMPIPLMKDVSGTIVFDKDDTILTSRLNVRKAQGIVTANEKTALTGGNGCGRGRITIGGAVYDEGLSGAGEYLGYNVEYYWRETDGESVVVYADPAKRSEDFRIYADEILKFENNQYIYEDSMNGRKRDKDVDITADVIYNGKAMPVISDSAVYTPENGYVTLIDNDRDGSFDVISIVDKKIMVLNSYDTRNYIIYDRYAGAPVKLDPDDDNCFITVSTASGNESGLDKIKAWDVLEVARSVDGSVTDIVICRDSVEGKITSVGTNDDGKPFIKIDSVEYVVGSQLNTFKTNNNIPFVTGQSYSFLLTTEGEIAGYTDIESAAAEKGQYGYLIQSEVDPDGGDFLFIRMLTEGGTVEKLTTTPERVRIDGVLYKDIIAADVAMPSGNALVYYWLNDEGKIKEFDTLAKSTKEGSDTLAIKGQILDSDSSDRKKYSSFAKSIGGKISFNENSIAFCVPSNPAAASYGDYSACFAFDYFEHYLEYVVTGYARNTGSPYSEAIIVTSKQRENFSKKLYLVQSVMYGLNDDEEPVYKVGVINGDGEKQLVTSDADAITKAKSQDGSVVGVEKGDIVQFSTNTKNEIDGASVLYRAREDKFYSGGEPVMNYSGYFHSMRAGFWDVYYKSDTQLRVVPRGAGFSDPLIIENMAVGKIFVYDEEEKVPYRTGTVSEIRDYYSSGVGSTIFARTNDTVLDFIVIYK